MKKFLIFMLVMLIIAAAGFYMGWAQFRVPPGSYGVIRSKTHGTDAHVVREGELRWVWYMLIPTNAEVRVFSISPVTHSISSAGFLPSGRLYAELAGVDMDFEWGITGNLSFSINPDALPDLVVRRNISNQEDLAALQNDYINRIEIFAVQRLMLIGQNESLMDSLILTSANPELNHDIQTAFPELENIDCTLQAVIIPDFRLYNSFKDLYDEYLNHQNRALEMDLARNAEARIAARLRMDELERYGELLTRYPVLLQFLAIENRLPSVFE